MRQHKHGGFSLVELLVVIAILAVMASIALVGLGQGGFMSNNDLQNATRELHSLLRAAQIYAATYNVQTAVAYQLDNYIPPPDANDPAFYQPLGDSYTGGTVRAIFAAAMVYQLPSNMGTLFSDKYYFVPRAEGSFKLFKGNMTVLLQDIANLQPLYYSTLPRMYLTGDPVDNNTVNQLYKLGMQSIELIVENEAIDSGSGLAYSNPLSAAFPAHVFLPGGKLEVTGWPSNSGPVPERFQIHVAPRPGEIWIKRSYFEEEGPYLSDGTTNVRTMPIEIFRATGRVRIDNG